MKKLIMMVAVGVMVNLCYGQKLKESEVPGEVKGAFAKAYPTVKEVKWEREKELFEAEFHMNKIEMSVVLNAKGLVLEEEVEMKKEELPKGILATLTRDFAKYKVEEASKITANGVISFEAEVEMGKESFDLLFDGSGKLLKKIKKEEKEKD